MMKTLPTIFLAIFALSAFVQAQVNVIYAPGGTLTVRTNLVVLGSVTATNLTTEVLNAGTLNLTNKLARSLITNGVPNQLVSNDGTGLLSSLGVGSGLAIVGTNLTSTGGGSGSATAEYFASNISFMFDNGDAVLAPGTYGYITIPYNCTIYSATLLSEQSGSVVIDVWKDTYANYPPTVADTITASDKPTITAALKSQDLVLTGWTTNVIAGDVLGFALDSVTSIQKVLLSLKVMRTSDSVLVVNMGSGGGFPITTGYQSSITIPYACTISSVTMLADQSGSIVVDIWKDTYANYPPTVADTITASAKPTISGAIKSQDTTLTGWTKTVNAGDVLSFSVDSVTSITSLNLALKITR